MDAPETQQLAAAPGPAPPAKPAAPPAPLLEAASSPHLTTGDSVPSIMWTVVAALLPAAAVGFFYFGVPALVVLVTATGGCVAFEAIFQRRALSAVLTVARRSGKQAIIHSRYAWRDSFALASGTGVDWAVFHWYTGPTNVLREILDRGYFISAAPAADYHAEHRRAVKEAPLESLLLETDCPVVYQGHRSEPADVARVLRIVADIKGLFRRRRWRRRPPTTLAFSSDSSKRKGVL